MAGSEFSLSSDKKDSESSDDNIDGDKMVSNEGSNEPTKTWVIEWKKGFNTASEEKHNYAEALAIFNEKTTVGIDAILYELQKSPRDLSVIKKTPVLNSIKAKQRRIEDLENKKAESTKEGNKENKKSGGMKLRIILLIAVIGALVLIISLINALTDTGGIMINPNIIIPTIETNIGAGLEGIQTSKIHQ
jgi:hypothetical protein